MILVQYALKLPILRSSGTMAFSITPKSSLQASRSCLLTAPQKFGVAAVSNILDWRDHPLVNVHISFPTWVVPKPGSGIQTLLGHDRLQEYLATRFELLSHIRTRLKLVQDPKDRSDSKVILLHPETPPLDQLPEDVQELLASEGVESNGQEINVSFCHTDFTASYVLCSILPKEVHPPPNAFETIGHVAHLNLKELHLPYKSIIGEVILETLPAIRTVICKEGKVSGPYRTYGFGVLAGTKDTSVKLQENGVHMKFDVAKVYWSSRLSEERRRILRQFKPNQIIADAFCGVGAVLLQAAKKQNCKILANDWNPDAIASLQENIVSNILEENFQLVQCGDAYDFLMKLGMQPSNSPSDKPHRLPDHVLLNFPLGSIEFLGALRWWNSPPGTEKSNPRLHVYTFARGDQESGRTADQVATDMVAESLLPRMNSINRTQELNEEYGCDVEVHNVRDVAPGKVVMCISFTLTPSLLKVIQGG